jgi:hypothetical protein
VHHQRIRLHLLSISQQPRRQDQVLTRFPLKLGREATIENDPRWDESRQQRDGDQEE